MNKRIRLTDGERLAIKNAIHILLKRHEDQENASVLQHLLNKSESKNVMVTSTNSQDLAKAIIFPKQSKPKENDEK